MVIEIDGVKVEAEQSVEKSLFYIKQNSLHSLQADEFHIIKHVFDQARLVKGNVKIGEECNAIFVKPILDKKEDNLLFFYLATHDKEKILETDFTPLEFEIFEKVNNLHNKIQLLQGTNGADLKSSIDALRVLNNTLVGRLLKRSNPNLFKQWQ